MRIRTVKPEFWTHPVMNSLRPNPKRVQLSRKKGWRKPENCVVVSRPSKWGNPFDMEDHGEAVAFFDRCARRRAVLEPEWLEPLRGKDLACWCKLSDKCHADVLLELANA
jgi:hypothetical protein